MILNQIIRASIVNLQETFKEGFRTFNEFSTRIESFSSFSVPLNGLIRQNDLKIGSVISYLVIKL